jgi:hypothetical protein
MRAETETLARKTLLCLAVLLYCFIIGNCNEVFAQTAEWQHPPRLYFKTPARMLTDNTRVFWPLTLPQVTTDFLATLPSAATEVQIFFFWSQLCPTGPNACDFSIVDKTLQFWAEHNKKVILAIQTVSYPEKIIINHSPSFTQATPDWVLQRVRTFVHQTRTMGQARTGSGAASPDIDATFPVYWDGAYIREVEHLIDTFAARYDGNPVLSGVFMTFGLNGEDLSFQDTPGLSASNWIDGFEVPIVNRYVDDFKRTQLEFPVGFLGYLRLRALRANDIAAEGVIDRFTNKLIQYRLLFSNEGLSSMSLDWLQKDAMISAAFNLRTLIKAHSAGDPISLEMWRPFSGKGMEDLGAIEAAVRFIKPNRLGLFNPTTSRGEAQTQEFLKNLGYQ